MWGLQKFGKQEPVFNRAPVWFGKTKFEFKSVVQSRAEMIVQFDTLNAYDLRKYRKSVVHPKGLTPAGTIAGLTRT